MMIYKTWWFKFCLAGQTMRESANTFVSEDTLPDRNVLAGCTTRMRKRCVGV